MSTPDLSGLSTREPRKARSFPRSALAQRAFSGSDSVLVWLLSALLVSVALLLQASLFGPWAWRGVVPDLVVLVVIATALVRGPHLGVVLGFAAGVLLDLAPPADHVAGRWALALLAAGWLAGKVGDSLPTPEPGLGISARVRAVAGPVVAAGLACVFVATSLFALSGVIVGDPEVSIGEVLPLLAISWAWDLLLAVVIIPTVIAAHLMLADRQARFSAVSDL